MKIEKYNIIQCVGIVLLALILMIMGYTIKSKQEQIEALESANTSLQTYCSELEHQNNLLQFNNKELQTELDNQQIKWYNNILELIDQIKPTNKKLWFILYKSIETKDTIYNHFTDEQIKMMQKCIETETFEADFDSKINVACVILNRVEHDLYPTDPIEIITEKNQFSYGRNKITEDTILALEYAYYEDTTNGCIAFRSDCSPNEWNGWTKQFTDESGHTFYK